MTSRGCADLEAALSVGGVLEADSLLVLGARAMREAALVEQDQAYSTPPQSCIRTLMQRSCMHSQSHLPH